MKSYSFSPVSIPLCDDYEVIVVGGGPSGCAAAIASARRGAKTLLLEATGCLGGMGTSGLVPAWCPFSDYEKIVYRGIAEEIFTAAKEGMTHVKPDDLNWVPIDPERLKIVYDRKVTEAGADVLFNTFFCSVEAENGAVKTLICANKAGLVAYKAKVYIDCTGDADLAAWAGAEILPLEEGESYQLATHCFQLSNVDMQAYKSGPWLHPNNPESPIHSIVASGNYDIPDTHFCNNQVYPNTIGFNAGHIDGVDSTDPHTVSRAMMRGRALAHEIKRALADYQPKTFADAKVSLTAPSLGIRESRRILGDYYLTAEDYLARRSFEDEICRNSYYLDVHRKKGEKKLLPDGTPDPKYQSHRYAKGESHGVPYRCLTPKGLSNVLVAGRSISADRPVHGSTRVMPVCLCMGEAAGKAAVLAKDMTTVDVHKVDVKELRRQILEDGGYIL